MADIDTKLLRSFVSVAETGSMTLSAGQTHQTQGAVSQQIKRLETLLGQKLFERTGSGLHLTASGRQLLPHAKGVIVSCQNMLNEFRDADPSNTVRLGVPYDLVSGYLTLMLDKVATAYPEIDIDLQCETSTTLKAMVNAHELDLALVQEPLAEAEGDILRVDPLVWIGKPGGRAYKKRPLPVSLVTQSCAFKPGVEKALASCDFAWRTVFENGDLNATLATVRSDMSVSASLKSLVPDDLVALPPTLGLPELPDFAISLFPGFQNLRGSVLNLSGKIQDIFAP